MRELIALRAKIDLLLQDKENDMNECGDPDRWLELLGTCAAYNNVRHMIDDMVGDELERMYAKAEEEDGND